MILDHQTAVSVSSDAQTVLRKTFGDSFHIQVGVANFLGPVVTVVFANRTRETATNHILENAPLYGKGLIHSDRDGGCFMNSPFYGRNNLKYRKIKGRDEAEVLEKFVTWMISKKDEILAIG